jgi:hypothetical protein
VRLQRLLSFVLIVGIAPCLASAQALKENKTLSPVGTNEVLWRDPGPIASRNLYYGPGGKEDEPQGPIAFVDEDHSGTSPKFNVRDRDAKKWKAKLGEEAQPETVATRLLWAVGFNTNENYFVPDLKVEGMPHLKRGSEFVKKDGEVHQVRLQRSMGDEKKAGTWDWRHNPFKGTREFNGLRVMMALISNWDLKRENNAIYLDSGHKLYEVSDLGASFGMAGKSYTDALAKNNLEAYKKTKFIAKASPKYVDFNFPTHPPFLYVFNLPFFVSRVRTRWVGRHIPREDAKWVGSLLSQLTSEQIHDAFRSAGYTAEQVDQYTAALQKRIGELSEL